MPRVHVWIPEELADEFRERRQGEAAGLSELLQKAMRDALGCRHWKLACTTCALPVDRPELVNDVRLDLYRQVLWALGDHLAAGGTLQGFGQILKSIALRNEVYEADRIPLPRRTRSQREEQADRDWAAAQQEAVTPLPREADSRARHPTAGRRRPAARSRSKNQEPDRKEGLA